MRTNSIVVKFFFFIALFILFFKKCYIYNIFTKKKKILGIRLLLVII